jgi:hypothetical protein
MRITKSMVDARMAARYGVAVPRNHGLALIYAAWFGTWAAFVLWAIR